MAFFSESNIPGIGKKIRLKTHSGDNISLIIHHDGKRELYVMGEDKKPIVGLAFLDEEARRIGDLLTGNVFKPKCIETLEKHMEEIEVEWFKIPTGSKIIGDKLGTLNIRKTVNASIVGIIRNERMIYNPDNDVNCNESDTFIVLGRRTDLKAFSEVLRKSVKEDTDLVSG